MRLRITTWNVNSVRARLAGVAALVKAQAPDVLCLQETKVVNASFPRAPFAALGYRHSVINGCKGYNGVAIFSRLPFEASAACDWCDRADGRHAVVALAGGVEIHNFYVPSGGDTPDPEANDKFAHKLRFLSETTDWFAARKAAHNRFVMVGDLNVAPLETDVWSHRALRNVVSHTAVEVAALERLRAAHDWIDAVRRFIPPDERVYSWWSYRARDWQAADRGRRLDHVWVTPALGDGLRGVSVLKQARGWRAPSDHVPISLDLEL
ncbi:MAG: exodeoxyribonuclease III [Alphaproteobacteria bacterium]